MPAKKEKQEIMPMLKTVEQMSRISGIGENKLRSLMDKGELEFVQNGNRRLIADTAIWDWYSRAKTAAISSPAIDGYRKSSVVAEKQPPSIREQLAAAKKQHAAQKLMPSQSQHRKTALEL